MRNLQKQILKLVAGAWLLTLPAPAVEMPPIKTVFVILMENYGWSSIHAGTNAPFINDVLLPQAAHCEQYYPISNFAASLLSYLWLEAGTTFGLTTYDTNCYSPPTIWHVSETNHLTSQLNRAGVSWRAYQECIGSSVVPLADNGCYVVRHDPFVYFDDVTGTNDPTCAYGIAHIRPYSELGRDLANNTVAQYNFITPGQCSNMHESCPPLTNNILQGDTWLSTQIPMIMSSSAYTNNGAIFITWDDCGGPSAPIGMIVLSPLVRASGYVSYARYDHSSTLRTMQDVFGVGPYLGGAATATNLSELFINSTPPYPPAGLRLGITQPTGDSLQLTVTGVDTNRPLILLASSNLATWTTVGMNVATGAILTLVVTNGPSKPPAPWFYRVAQPSP